MLSLEFFKYLVEYASWMPDPESCIISTSWENTYIYAFLPFSMIWPAINKVEKEAENALIIVPMWPTQTWSNRALELATATPINIESRHLHLPGISKQHPLCPKLNLMAICCSKNKHQQIMFRKQLTKSSLQLGHHRLNTNTSQFSEKGKNFMVGR